MAFPKRVLVLAFTVAALMVAFPASAEQPSDGGTEEHSSKTPVIFTILEEQAQQRAAERARERREARQEARQEASKKRAEKLVKRPG